jgi:hypothetical protein
MYSVSVALDNDGNIGKIFYEDALYRKGLPLRYTAFPS